MMILPVAKRTPTGTVSVPIFDPLLGCLISLDADRSWDSGHGYFITFAQLFQLLLFQASWEFGLNFESV